MKIYPVILSGGSGTRLWPLSRSAKPKQLLPLVSGLSMLQETVLRLHAWPELMPPLFVAGNEHRFMIAEQLRSIEIAPLNILLEPFGKNTAPAIAAAAHFLKKTDPDAIMLVLPADHVINNVDAFRDATLRALKALQPDGLITFGIVPTTPETGYGYIRRGEPVTPGSDSYKVDAFVEKPELELARSYLESGNYYWNSGMFLFRADTYLSELNEFHPETVQASGDAVKNAYLDLDFCRLEEKSFSKCFSESIDYAVMERTKHAVVVPADMGWNDVGSWGALLDVLDCDADCNAIRGDVYTDNTSDTLIRAESRFVATLGVKDMVIVETADAVLVAHKDSVQSVKNVVEYLKKHKRSEHINHTKVYRPWGSYEEVVSGERFQVKRITVNPGEKLSLQMHHHRAEHWVVVRGTAKVTCGEKVSLLSENQSTYIPIGETHRLENPGKFALELIEIQSGSYLGEDDIVRFEDIYQRS
ncbi:mannose-1-phosphate guanylyltransferase/mannose-6-phosphate isomerase [Oxalobacteraceae bacterium GrIS 2.11]